MQRQYDELYQQQHVELDVAKRHEIVQQMLEIMYEEAPYAVLYKYDDLQAIRSDRWENFVRQPAETGPVLFTNTSPAYVRARSTRVAVPTAADPQGCGPASRRRRGHHRWRPVAALTPKGNATTSESKS